MDELGEKLRGVRMKDIRRFYEENEALIVNEDHAFADYMRKVFREKKLSQQEIYLLADIPERYGYKLISQEKHTRQRDIILRICYAAQFTLEETQKALHLYRMPELYAEFARDALIMDEVPREAHDCAVSCLVTESRVLRF